jgi:nucleoside-diphosphate-sugar epimerase
LKLLLDTHHSPAIAERLCADGQDVVAAATDPDLAALPDEDLLRVCVRDGRVLVTEDVKDFDRIVRTWSAAGEHHRGVIFTSARRFHRGSRAYPANVVRSLERLLANAPAPEVDWVHWLD